MFSKSKFTGPSTRGDINLTAWLRSRKTEVALEPDLPIIDPHHHLWEVQSRGTYLIEDVLADMGGGHNIISSVFLECRAMYRADGPEAMKPVGEVEFVNGIAAMSASGNYGPTRVAEGILGHADLMLGAAVGEVLDEEIKVGGGRFKGIRHSTPWDPSEVGMHTSRFVPPQQLLDPKLREGFAELGKRKLTYDAWLYHPQLGDLLDLARRFPDTTIIIDHVGGFLGVGPYQGQQAAIMPQWKKDMAALAACPNVHVKLGGLGMIVFGFDFHEKPLPPSSAELAEAWRPYIEPCIEMFGVNRSMFESNFPPDKQSCGYTELWNAFKIITKGASAADKKALYSGTAARVYSLRTP